MKSPTFAYERPQSLAEALALLAQKGADARPLAGGQSLIPMLALRLARPSVLVDLGRVEGLDELTLQDGVLVIGAMVRQRQLERNALVAEHLPLLVAATKVVGHPAIRNRGTLGGSLAHADPSAEYPAVALALDAEFVIQGPRGERVIPAQEFFLGPFTTALATDELLTSIRFPIPPTHSGWGMAEVARRHSDFALAGAVALLARADDGTCARAAIALFGVATRPLRATQAEQALVGRPFTTETFREVATLATESIDEPLSDVHGSAAYRRQLVPVVVRRALEEAAQRAAAR